MDEKITIEIAENKAITILKFFSFNYAMSWRFNSIAKESKSYD
jgi:hypothetical protein